jgi:hypothetical protein
MDKNTTILLIGGGIAALYLYSKSQAAAQTAATAQQTAQQQANQQAANQNYITQGTNLISSLMRSGQGGTVQSPNNPYGCYGGGTCSSTNVYGPPSTSEDTGEADATALATVYAAGNPYG